jgi:signal transduction histidine kinase
MARRSARDWLLEVSLAVVATLLGLFFVSQSVAEGDGAPLPLEAAAGVLSFVGLVLFRRRHPVGLTLVLIPFGILLGMPMGATPIALFSVALHRPARVTIALAGLHAACVATVYALVLGLTRQYYESVAFVVLLHVSLVAIAMTIRAHRQLVAAWAERARQAEEGQRLRIDQARLAERERIAREMHDVLAHRVSLLALHAGALEVRRDASAEEREAAGVIRQGAHDALEDLRMLLGMLRAPAEDRPQPTLDDVPDLVERSRLAGADICFTMTGLQRRIDQTDALREAGFLPGRAVLRDDDAEDDLDDDVDVPDQTGRHAYRIIQEALTNALKHAPGAPVRVNVDVVWRRGLDVRVDNDLVWDDPYDRRRGNHAEPIPGAGAGLAGLRERVQLVGGRLEHGPTPKGEFNLRAWLPWQT